MVNRYSSRRADLYEEFLKKRLAGARRHHRIAGYFKSSLLELAGEELAAIPEVRIICNTEVSAEDVRTVRMATGPRRKKLEETTESLSSDWEETADVLNQAAVMREFIEGW